MVSQVTKDLMAKASDDMVHALARTVSLAGRDRMPVAMAGAAGALGCFAAELQATGTSDTDSLPKSDPDCILLAALILASTANRSSDPVSDGYKQFYALKGGGQGPSEAEGEAI